MPSTRASTLSTSSRFRSGSTTAASSPTPTRSQSGAGGREPLIRAISSRSPRVETVSSSPAVDSWFPLPSRQPPAPSSQSPLLGVINGAGFADDGHLNLAGVLELILDAAGDILREPDGLLIRDFFAFDHDADFTARLERERLRHAFE